MLQCIHTKNAPASKSQRRSSDHRLARPHLRSGPKKKKVVTSFALDLPCDHPYYLRYHIKQATRARRGMDFAPVRGPSRVSVGVVCTAYEITMEKPDGNAETNRGIDRDHLQLLGCRKHRGWLAYPRSSEHHKVGVYINSEFLAKFLLFSRPLYHIRTQYPRLTIYTTSMLPSSNPSPVPPTLPLPPSPPWRP